MHILRHWRDYVETPNEAGHRPRLTHLKMAPVFWHKYTERITVTCPRKILINALVKSFGLVDTSSDESGRTYWEPVGQEFPAAPAAPQANHRPSYKQSLPLPLALLLPTSTTRSFVFHPVFLICVLTTAFQRGNTLSTRPRWNESLLLLQRPKCLCGWRTGLGRGGHPLNHYSFINKPYKNKLRGGRREEEKSQPPLAEASQSCVFGEEAMNARLQSGPPMPWVGLVRDGTWAPHWTNSLSSHNIYEGECKNLREKVLVAANTFAWCSFEKLKTSYSLTAWAFGAACLLYLGESALSWCQCKMICQINSI